MESETPLRVEPGKTAPAAAGDPVSVDGAGGDAASGPEVDPGSPGTTPAPPDAGPQSRQENGPEFLVVRLTPVSEPGSTTAPDASLEAVDVDLTDMVETRATIRRILSSSCRLPARAARGLAMRLRAARERLTLAAKSRLPVPASAPAGQPAPDGKPGDGGEGSPSPSRKGALVKGFALVAVAVAVLLAALLLRPHIRPGKRAQSPRAVEGGGAPGPTLELSFTVRIRDASSGGVRHRHYLRATFVLELPDARVQETARMRTPMIRDVFVGYLSERGIEDLQGSEAMNRVKRALAQRLSEVVRDVPVRAIYFSTLVVQ